MNAHAIVLLVACSVACRGPKVDEDEARVRALFAIPTDATVVSLHASPDKNGWQREGLRIVATFHLTKPAFSAPPWSPAPLPANVSTFTRPPNELFPAPTGGTFRCEVGVYTTGTSHAMSPCASAPAHFDMYQAATFDPATGTLSTVVTYYY